MDSENIHGAETPRIKWRGLSDGICADRNGGREGGWEGGRLRGWEADWLTDWLLPTHLHGSGVFVSPTTTVLHPGTSLRARISAVGFWMDVTTIHLGEDTGFAGPSPIRRVTPYRSEELCWCSFCGCSWLSWLTCGRYKLFLVWSFRPKYLSDHPSSSVDRMPIDSESFLLPSVLRREGNV